MQSKCKSHINLFSCCICIETPSRFVGMMLTLLVQCFIMVIASNSADSLSGEFMQAACVDGAGRRYSPGDGVWTGEPCRRCVCGAKGNILCETFNLITDCQPPSDAPCRVLNGTICCDRTFHCQQLPSCSVKGQTYQAGEIVPGASSDTCLECRCSSHGKIRCEPASSCTRPSWIARRSATDCVPNYTHHFPPDASVNTTSKITDNQECCPKDYSCKCQVFNASFTQSAPRQVSRCQTCTCSNDIIGHCQPVPCKLPYKFSDRCRAIYHANDCCPVDYDCQSAPLPSSLPDSDVTIQDAHSIPARKLVTTAETTTSFASTTSTTRKPTDNDVSGEAAGPLPSALPQTGFRMDKSLHLDYDYKNLAQERKNPRLQLTANVVGSGRNQENNTLVMTETLNFKSTPVIISSFKPEMTTVASTTTGFNLTSTTRDSTITSPVFHHQPTTPTTTADSAADALIRVFMKQAERNVKQQVNTISHSNISHFRSVATSLVSGQSDIINTTGSNETFREATTMGDAVGDTTVTVTDSNTTVTHLNVSTPPSLPPVSGNELVKGQPQNQLQTDSQPASLSTSTTIMPTSTNANKSTSQMQHLLENTSHQSQVVPISPSTEKPKQLANDKTEKNSSTILMHSSNKQESKLTDLEERNNSWSGSSSPSRLSWDPVSSMTSADANFLADDLSYKLFGNHLRSSSFTNRHSFGGNGRLDNPLPIGAAAINDSFTLNSSSLPSLGSSFSLSLLQGQQAENESASIKNATMIPILSASANSGIHQLKPALTTTTLSVLQPHPEMANVTVPPDFQVVTFGSVPARSRAKSAGQLLPPMLPGLGGPQTPFIPFTTEIEFKGFGMLPEVELKPLPGLGGDLAKLAGMAALLGGAGGGGGLGGPSIGGQLAGGPPPGGPPQGQPQGAASPANRMAAAAAAHDAMEELAEGGTGDGALALAAALMHNPHRPVPARLVESTEIGMITTSPPTVAIVFPNGTFHTAPARSAPLKMAQLTANPSAEIKKPMAEFNQGYPSPNHYHQYTMTNQMSNPWSSPTYTGTALNTAQTTTTDKPAPTKDPFPFEAVVDVLEEGRGPQLTQLLGALQYFGRSQQPQGLLPPSFAMNSVPTRSGGFGGMNMMNMNMMNQRSSYFPSYQPSNAFGLGMGLGMDGFTGFGMMPSSLFSLFAGALKQAPTSQQTPGSASSPASTSDSQTPKQQNRLNPGMNSGSLKTNALRPMYKVSSAMTESPLEGADLIPAHSHITQPKPANILMSPLLKMLERR